MSYGKTKKKPPSAKLSPRPWDAVKKLPLGMFHTLKGPIIGHVEAAGSRSVRVYAPACVNFMPPSNVIFLPVAFVEHYLDLHWATMFGDGPVPEVVAKGYLGYREEFIKGNYLMQPVVMNAAIEGKEHKVETTTAKEILEKCPACGAMLSNWRGHYPVLLPRSAERAESKWTCEMEEPNIRDKFPGYSPPRPMDA